MAIGSTWRRSKRRKRSAPKAASKDVTAKGAAAGVEAVTRPRKLQRTPAPSVSDASSNSVATAGAADNSLQSLLPRMKDALQTSFSPSKAGCREKEQLQIREFLGSCVENGHGSSMYICGSPGTGKTLSVDLICKEVFAQDSKTRIIQINAMILTKPQEIYVELFKRICGPKKGSVSPLEAAQALQSHFLAPKKSLTVCVIDEIDALLTRSQTVLYQLFELPKKTSSSLVLIGISNNIDLTDRFLPRLRARNCEPQLLVFQPYQHKQLRDILLSRIRGALPEDSQHCFDKMAIEFCARKVAAVSGDMRKCMDICRQCLDGVEEKLLEDKDAAPRVTISTMSRILSQSLGSEHVSRIKDLPIQKKLLLSLFAFHFKVHESKEVGLRQFEKWFKGFSKSKTGRRVPNIGSLNPSSPSFVDILTGLIENGLIILSKGKRIADRRVRVVCRIADIEYALKDVKQFKALFDELRAMDETSK